MKSKITLLSLVLSLMLMVVSLVGCTQETSGEVAKDPNQKGILVVSFGTSYADTREVTIEAVENEIKDAFKDYETRRAFTSDIIIKKLKDRDGIEIDTVKQGLQKMKDDGFSEVIVQPLHVINGAEYTDVVQIASEFKSSFDKFNIGSPLLTSVEDYKAVVNALKTQLPELKDNEAVAFMGHGTHHPANSAYACFQYALEDMDVKNVFMGTVEGYPDLDNVIEKLNDNHIETVTLMPFMLVAGDHANNDMAGDEEDAWKSILKKNGFVVNTYIHGLGENKAIQELYVAHTKAAIEDNGEEE